MLGIKRVNLWVGLLLMVLSAFTVADGGFTPIVPSSDSRLIYVSSSAGSDSSDCLSEAAACKTLAAGVGKMRAGYPDHLYLKRGDVWRDQNLSGIKSGRSANEPSVVAFYGEAGARPKIERSKGSFIDTGVSSVHKFSFTHIIGIEFDAYAFDPANAGYDEGGDLGPVKIALLGEQKGVLFEDNRFNYMEVTIQDWQGGIPREFVIRRNIFTGAYARTSSLRNDRRPSNVYIKGVDGIRFEENVFDQGGWNPFARNAAGNMYNHNLYLNAPYNSKALFLVGNIITRASSHGVQMRNGGVARDNFFGRNAVSLLNGYSADFPLIKGDVSVVVDNVISEGYSMIKGDNPCAGVNLCTPALWGLDLQIFGDADRIRTGNIVSKLAPTSADSLWSGKYKQLQRDSYRPNLGDARVQDEDNIAYRWSSDDEGVGVDYVDPERTLGSYNASLGGADSFEDFMYKVLNRPLQTWDEKYTAYAINDYIRDGFRLVSAGSSSSSSSSSSGSSSSSSSSGGDTVVIEISGKITCTIEKL